MQIRSYGLALLLLLNACGFSANASSTNDLAARRTALKEALDEQWQYTLRTNPEFASMLGDKRYNDQVADVSIEAVQRDLEKTRYFLTKFQAIDVAGFPEQEVLNKRLMVRGLQETLEGERFRGWEMPVNQMGGVHIDTPRLVSLLQFTSVKDYRDYISRLQQWPRVFDQTIAQMRKGMADGLMPPQVVLAKIPEQARLVVDHRPEDSPFAAPLQHFPDAVPEEDRGAIRKEVLDAIQHQITPAYQRFATFVHDEYAPRGQTNVGMWALPDGASRYAFAVKQMTTSDMTPDAIHQLGLAQVAELEASELEIARKLRFADVRTLRTSMDTNAKIHVHSADEFLDLYRRDIDGMYTKLPLLFSRLPKAKVTVVAIESFRAKESTTGYIQAAPDGSRPGRVEVNTYAWEKQTTIDVEATAYHEGVPGHHLQVAIQQELKGIPEFRREGGYGAFMEGWALYSEGLGKELGFYQDPYSDFGRLESELFRAIRLVVDTGLHQKRWSREQVVEYFHQHSGQPESMVQSETDRYIVWPGQALSYKIGQLAILQLRDKAKARLGTKFDVRAFHDEILGAGALPLDVLSERINRWIEAQKTS